MITHLTERGGALSLIAREGTTPTATATNTALLRPVVLEPCPTLATS